MTIRLYTVVYAVMMVLVAIVVTGVYFDHPRAATASNDDDSTPAATADYETYTPSPTDGPVIDAKPEPANQA